MPLRRVKHGKRIYRMHEILCVTASSQLPSTTRDQRAGVEEKRLRALNKKLREIELLQERLQRGDTLDSQQHAKLSTVDVVLKQIEEVMGVQA